MTCTSEMTGTPEEARAERVALLVEALQEELEGFIEQIRMECSPLDQDAIAHRIAHLQGHFPKDCIHTPYDPSSPKKRL